MGGITLEDLVGIIRACDAIEIDRCTPPYLQDFLAMRLERRPDLSAKVRRLRSTQMDRLCECIQAVHVVLRQ
jgi:hypothetical protein